MSAGRERTYRRGDLVRLRDGPTTVMRVHGVSKIAGYKNYVSVGRDGGVLYPLEAIEPATRFDDPRLYGPLICDAVVKPFMVQRLEGPPGQIEVIPARMRTEWPDAEFCAA